MSNKEGKKGILGKLSFFLILLACTTTTSTQQSSCNNNACDIDGDGFRANTAQCRTYAVKKYDCDDSNKLVFPGAPEICDSVDNNCDGKLLAGEATDLDKDGYFACEDCNDNEAAVFPGAEEVCNGMDDNCDDVLLVGETEDLDQDGILACFDENDKEIEAVVEIKPESFNENTGKFTAFVQLPDGFGTVITCVADGAVAISITTDEASGIATCKFNRDEITVLPVDTFFEVSGTTSDGFSFYGTDEIMKVVE